MGIPVDRSPEARAHRRPHLFLSHSSNDKPFVRQLAEHLNACGVDAWFDEWELQVGDSLHDVISNALERSKYLAFVISRSFLASNWAIDELKQSLARERRSDRGIVLPLLHEDVEVPAFLEDKIYLDFRNDYHHALTRLAGMIHGLRRVRIEDAVSTIQPESVRDTGRALQYAGHDPAIILDSQDYDEIERAGGRIEDDGIHFFPDQIADAPNVSQRVRNLMHKIMHEY